MLLNRKSQQVNTFTFGITPEEARKVRRQKELDKMPTLKNKFKKAKKNAKRRELKEKYKPNYNKPHQGIRKLL